MPLDFCHPTAPHKRLRLPEWYLSSLMMDRALDAVVRRVKKLDRAHDVPYLAGYSLDGKTFTPIGEPFVLNSEWMFFMGYRYGIFNYATQSLGGVVNVASFTMTSP